MKWPKGILLIFLGGAAAILAILILIPIQVERSRREVVAYRTKLEAMGEKLRTRDLASATPAVSNEAGKQFIEAANDLKSARKTKPYMPFLVGMMKPAPGTAEIAHLRASNRRGNADVPWAALEEALPNYRPYLDRISTALQTENPEIHQNYTEGHALNPSHIAERLVAGQILGAECVLNLRDGKAREAVEKVRAILALAKFSGKQQTLIEQLICASLMGIAACSTWEILQAEVSAADLASLQHAWQQPTPRESLVPALRMERSWAAEVFRRPAPYAGATKVSASSGAHAIWQSLERIKEAFKNQTGRYNDEMATLKGFQALIERAQSPNWSAVASDTQAISRSTAGFYLSSLILKGVTPTLEKIAITDTSQKLVIAAIAIRRYQLGHSGQLPQDLQELVPHYLPSVPLDIMDGNPLRYKRLENGFLLYGIGFDGRDNEGKPEASHGAKYRGYLDGKDIVWPRPFEEAKP